jgi:6-phosphogluconolactonase
MDVDPTMPKHPGVSQMRTVFLSLLAITMTNALSTTASAEQLLYLASTADKTIVAYKIDGGNGMLSKRFSVDLPGNGGAMAFSPDKKFVYASVTGLPDNAAGVATYRRHKNGTLTLLDTAKITSRPPYIQVDPSGRFLLAAHYGAGDVTMYSVVKGVATSKLLAQIKTAKTAHCIELDPSGQFVYVPHTAPNRLYQFVLDTKAGTLLPNDPPFVDGPDTKHRYHEPRHYKHHPKLPMGFTSNENGGGITAWAFDKTTGRLTRKDTLSTLPPNLEGTSHAADIQITPNGRFAYVSNRCTTKLTDGQKPTDTLCAVAIDSKTGNMKIIGHYATGYHPRATCIDLEGKFFFAAGQRSNDLHTYRINRKTGELKPIKVYQTGGTPIWVMCARAR